MRLAPARLRAHRRLASIERIVICDGMARSASTWSFNVALMLLRSAEVGPVQAGYDESVEAFFASLPSGTGNAVLKSHRLDQIGRRLATSGRARVVYTWREPADAVASAMAFFSWDFATACGVIERSLRLRAFHLETGSALILSYGEIVAAPAAALEQVAEYLEVDVARGSLDEISRATSLESMRARADAVESTGGPGHDPESLLHPGHVRDGGSYGRDVLTAEQLAVLEAMSARFGLRP